MLDWFGRYNTLPSDRNPSSPLAFGPKIQKAKAWSEDYGRPVQLGEFGAYTKADQESRAHFYGAFRQALEAAGIGGTIWDWKSGFNYWDPRSGQPLPGMREALFSAKPRKPQIKRGGSTPARWGRNQSSPAVSII